MRAMTVALIGWLYAFAVVLLLDGCVSASDVLPLLSGHVLFVATAGTLYGAVAALKRVVPREGAVWRLYWRTMPLHPVLAGMALGVLFPALLPADVGAGRVAAGVYFGAAGVLATHARDLLRTWAKYRRE